jgi:hypothetical protein
VRAEVGTVTLRQLIERFLADPVVGQLRYLPDLEQLLGAGADEYGPSRVSAFGRLQKAAFRDKLIGQKLSLARVNRYLAAPRRMWHWDLLASVALDLLLTEAGFHRASTNPPLWQPAD